jgi:hypothetical protein
LGFSVCKVHSHTTSTGLCFAVTFLQVEWYSALEGAVAKIVKLVAGVDDEDQAATATSGRQSGKSKDWAEQLERSYVSAGSHSGCMRGCFGTLG